LLYRAGVRAVITRVQWARVRVEGALVGEIESGICALIGVGQKDEERDAVWLADKICGCRCFRDEQGKMNRSLLDGHGHLLAISQFTLYGDMRRGNRPSFGAAMAPEAAQVLFERLCTHARSLGIRVQTGQFGASMAVESLNDGPVTLLLDSEKTF
jgi:D-tyrosyl-tRNA(Tyr) deacylase